MYKIAASIIILLASSMTASAGFKSWTIDREDDPFTKGQRVTVNFMNSLRSGIIVICDTSENGLMVRSIPGFAYESIMDGVEPTIQIAIDGELILEQSGETGAVGDNLAVAQTMLSTENAKKFVDAFAGAKKQIAIKDGIADRPQLLTAKGSTKSGEALVNCMARQTD